MPHGGPAPDRGGLPLNVNAAPFVPSGSGGVEAQAAPANAWQAQADVLGVNATHKPYDMSYPPAQQAGQPSPYAAYTPPHAGARGQAAADGGYMVTPPLAYSKPGAVYTPPATSPAIPPHPGPGPRASVGSAHHTPVHLPLSNGGTPTSLRPKASPLTAAMSVSCPSGHPLTEMSGSVVVQKTDGPVVCSGVFCRRCDMENLEVAGQPYYTCDQCKWDCCARCAEVAAYGSFGAAPIHLPQALHNPPMYAEELVALIRAHLAELGKEEPFGLSNMPHDKLQVYEAHLREKVDVMRPPVQHVIDVAPKVNVTKSGEKLKQKEKKRSVEKKPLKYRLQDRIMFTGGGRFSGNKVWKDGATLTIGDTGYIQEIDRSGQWPYKCQFDYVYVMLMESDITDAPPDPPKQKKKKEDKKEKERERERERKKKEAASRKETAPASTPSQAGAGAAAQAAASDAAPTQTAVSASETVQATKPRSVFDGPSVPLLLATAGLAVAAFFVLRNRNK